MADDAEPELRLDPAEAVFSMGSDSVQDSSTHSEQPEQVDDSASATPDGLSTTPDSGPAGSEVVQQEAIVQAAPLESVSMGSEPKSTMDAAAPCAEVTTQTGAQDEPGGQACSESFWTKRRTWGGNLSTWAQLATIGAFLIAALTLFGVSLNGCDETQLTTPTTSIHGEPTSTTTTTTETTTTAPPIVSSSGITLLETPYNLASDELQVGTTPTAVRIPSDVLARSDGAEAAIVLVSVDAHADAVTEPASLTNPGYVSVVATEEPGGPAPPTVYLGTRPASNLALARIHNGQLFIVSNQQLRASAVSIFVMGLLRTSSNLELESPKRLWDGVRLMQGGDDAADLSFPTLSSDTALRSCHFANSQPTWLDELPPEVTGVILNVTSDASTPGFIEVWGPDPARPDIVPKDRSNLNPSTNGPTTNLVIVPIGATADGHRVVRFARGGSFIPGTDAAPCITVDLLGWVTSAADGLRLTDLVDTVRARVTKGEGGTSADLSKVLGELSDSGNNGRRLVLANVTIDARDVGSTMEETTAAAYATGHTPEADDYSMRWIPGQVTAQLVFVEVGSDNKIRIRLDGGSPEVIVDLVGYVAFDS